MSVKLLTEHRLEFVSLKGGCIGSSESTLVKMRHSVAAQGVLAIRRIFSLVDMITKLNFQIALMFLKLV